MERSEVKFTERNKWNEEGGLEAVKCFSVTNEYTWNVSIRDSSENPFAIAKDCNG